MKKHLLILTLLFAVAFNASASVWYSVNYDKKTVAAMIAAFGTETATEMYYSEQVKDILEHYSAAEVGTAGIFLSKFLDRKAVTDLGIWSSSTENYYYRRIYSMVSAKIIPKNMDGGIDDAPLSPDDIVLGQLPVQDMHGGGKPLYAV